MAKIGEGHASAMFRQGLKEARAALYPNSNVAQAPEYGTVGTLTPGEVAEARRDTVLDAEQETEKGSILDQKLQKSAERTDPVREAREPDRDR
jgi:hypothetical protein